MIVSLVVMFPLLIIINIMGGLVFAREDSYFPQTLSDWSDKSDTAGDKS